MNRFDSKTRRPLVELTEKEQKQTAGGLISILLPAFRSTSTTTSSTFGRYLSWSPRG